MLHLKKNMGLKHWILPKDHFKTHLFFHVYLLNPTGLQGIDPSGLEHFLVGD